LITSSPTNVLFSGHGNNSDSGDAITGWNWRYGIDGQLAV